MTDSASIPDDGDGSGSRAALARLLDRDPLGWRSDLDQRYSILDQVLAGRRGAVIYPAARMGREAATRLRSIGVDIVAFGDRDPKLYDGRIDGIPVLSGREVAETHSDAAILISSTMYDSVIREDLEGRGCKFVVPVGYLNLRMPDIFRSREYDGSWTAAADSSNRAAIEAAHGLMDDEESRRVFVAKLAYYLSLDKRQLDGITTAETIYFDRSVYALGFEEVVVDGGAFVGDTLSSFLDRCAGAYRAYHAFEPDPVSFERLATVAAHDPARIWAIQAGIAARTSTGRLMSTRAADSRILSDQEAGGEEVSVVSLDEYFDRRQTPSMIKLDIEGGEADALLGASGLITNATPRLAISAYHYATDLWTIPLLLSALSPGSRISLRHYTREVDDTVCYAIPDSRKA